MNKAFYKDIVRSIKKGWKRFLSITIITALGVGMMTGLYASAMDMYYAADHFFDRQSLFDIRILSTLGLTQEDVDVLARVEGVAVAQGGYIETVHTNIDDVRKTADMTVLSQTGINRPQIMEGTLPQKPDEIAVTQKYLDESGKSMGDILIIMEDIEKEPTTEITDDVENSNPDQDGNNNTDLDFDVDMDIELDEKTETPTFVNTEYTITGVVLDPKDIRGHEDTDIAFRTTVTADYSFFITDEAARNDIFSVVYINLSETKELITYSDEYEDKVQTVIREIESRLKIQREQARYDAVIREAKEKIEDAENTMNEKFETADQQFTDAWQELSEAKQELADAEKELAEGEEQLLDAETELLKAEQELADGKKQLVESEHLLAEGEKELAQIEAELNDKAQKLVEGKQQLAEEREQALEQLDNAEQQLNTAQSQLDLASLQLEPGIEQLRMIFGDNWPNDEWNTLVEATAALAVAGAEDSDIVANTIHENTALINTINQLSLPSEQLESLSTMAVQTAMAKGKVNGGQEALDIQKDAFLQQKEASLKALDDAEAEIINGETQIAEARKIIEVKKLELEAGKAKLAEGWVDWEAGKLKLAEGWAASADGKTELNEGRSELEEGKIELADGETELIEKEQEYVEKKAEAQSKLADAYTELDDIDMTRWYVQDRYSLDSYSSLHNDLSSIEAIGRLFPIIFLLVAVLMSLTTMTRMVEEERGLIGTYKALGFGNGTIYQKYVLFAFLASLLGGILGDVFGFIFMPKFVANILSSLYSFPQYYLRFDILYGVGGVVLFIVAVVGATMLSCRNELRQMPAALLRPKTPRSGSRIWLERIPFIWNRLKFLNKVTARNLFRYKKRLLMTIGGIMGCTSLIVCGFAIQDSVLQLAPNQYDHIYQYDLLAVFEDKENEAIIQQLSNDSNIDDYLNLRIESIKLLNASGESTSVQLMVLAKDSTIDDYIHLEQLDGSIANLDDDGVYLTENATRILGLNTGDTISLQNLDLDQSEAAISGIVKNHLGNNVYMTQGLYERLFKTYEPNSVLAHLSDASIDQTAYAQALLENDSVLSAVSTESLREGFGFDLLNAVVLLLIVLAGGLAFVVLFTLSSTNISERVRELATIKVLGFYNEEVYQYVNKESLILTTIGVLIGLPAGRVLSGFLIATLNMPAIHFTVYITPTSYLVSAAITFIFALIVNFMTNRTLNRINMVEALKSVE